MRPTQGFSSPLGLGARALIAVLSWQILGLGGALATGKTPSGKPRIYQQPKDATEGTPRNHWTAPRQTVYRRFEERLHEQVEQVVAEIGGSSGVASHHQVLANVVASARREIHDPGNERGRRHRRGYEHGDGHEFGHRLGHETIVIAGDARVAK